MPNIYLGTSKIKNVYLGTSKINKIWLGNDLVFSSWNGELYNSGEEYSEATNGWFVESSYQFSPSGESAKNSNNLYIYNRAWAGTSSAVNLANYTKLYFTINLTGDNYSRCDILVLSKPIYTYAKHSISTSDLLVYKEKPATYAGDITLNLDVSSLTSGYIGIGADAGCKAYIKKVWLE